MKACLFDVFGTVVDWRSSVSRDLAAFARGNDGEIRGSGRSITGLHLRDALDRVAVLHPGLIVKFGGHAAAAGLTIRENDFERFRAAFEQAAQAVRHFLRGIAQMLGDERTDRILANPQPGGVLRSSYAG